MPGTIDPTWIEAWIEGLESCLPDPEEGYDEDTEAVLKNIISSMREQIAEPN